MQKIFDASVQMTDEGVYEYRFVDHLADTTQDGEIPDQYVSMLQGLLQQMRSLPPGINE